MAFRPRFPVGLSAAASSAALIKGMMSCWTDSRSYKIAKLVSSQSEGTKNGQEYGSYIGRLHSPVQLELRLVVAGEAVTCRSHGRRTLFESKKRINLFCCLESEREEKGEKKSEGNLTLKGSRRAAVSLFTNSLSLDLAKRQRG